MSDGRSVEDGALEARKAKAPRKSRFDFPRAKRNRDRFVFVVGALAPGRPRRLDRYLQERFEGYSRTFLQSLIKEGRVLVNGRHTRAAREVAAGDEIVLLLPEGLRSEPEEIPFDVLFEDEHLLVISKPPGVVVHPARGHLSGTLYNGLLHYLRDRLAADPSLHIGTVHRLDEETSGAILFALSREANADLTRQFENRLVSKSYLAIAHGDPAWEETEVDAPLGVDPACKYRVAVNGLDARPAQTKFRRLAAANGFCLVRAFPRTGRSHQVRVHMRHLGLPIVGDDLYGGMRVCEKWAADFPEGARVCLHSESLSFIHPADGREVTVCAPMPEDMRRICAAVDLDVGGLGRCGHRETGV